MPGMGRFDTHEKFIQIPWQEYAFYSCVQANSINPEPTRPMPSAHTRVPTRFCRPDHYKTIIPIQYYKHRRKGWGFYLVGYYYAVPTEEDEEPEIG